MNQFMGAIILYFRPLTSSVRRYAKWGFMACVEDHPAVFILIDYRTNLVTLKKI